MDGRDQTKTDNLMIAIQTEIGPVSRLEAQAWEVLLHLAASNHDEEKKEGYLKSIDIELFDDPEKIFANELANGLFLIGSMASSEEDGDSRAKKTAALLSATEYLLDQLQGSNKRNAIVLLSVLWSVSIGSGDDRFSNPSLADPEFWSAVIGRHPRVKAIQGSNG